MSDEQLTFKRYLEKYVPNLTPDEFAILQWCYNHDEDLYSASSGVIEDLITRGFLEIHNHAFDVSICHFRITDAGRAKYRELTAQDDEINGY